MIVVYIAAPDSWTRPFEPWSKLLIRGLHGDYIGSSLKAYYVYKEF